MFGRKEALLATAHVFERQNDLDATTPTSQMTRGAVASFRPVGVGSE